MRVVSAALSDEAQNGALEDVEEVVDGVAVEDGEAVETLPVHAAAAEGPLITALRALPPAPVVAAAGGFLAGVTTYVLVRLLRRRRIPRALARAQRGRVRGLEISNTRSFLVDVHLLKR